MADANVNWEFLFPAQAEALDVQPQRWEALQRKLTGLTRAGITNFVVAARAGDWDAPADVANLDEAQLRATYEGPLGAAYGAAYVALAGDVRLAVDQVVSYILGDNCYGGTLRFGFSNAAAATAAGIYAADTAITTPLP